MNLARMESAKGIFLDTEKYLKGYRDRVNGSGVLKVTRVTDQGMSTPGDKNPVRTNCVRITLSSFSVCGTLPYFFVFASRAGKQARR